MTETQAPYGEDYREELHARVTKLGYIGDVGICFDVEFMVDRLFDACEILNIPHEQLDDETLKKFMDEEEAWLTQELSSMQEVMQINFRTDILRHFHRGSCEE